MTFEAFYEFKRTKYLVGCNVLHLAAKQDFVGCERKLDLASLLQTPAVT